MRRLSMLILVGAMIVPGAANAQSPGAEASPPVVGVDTMDVCLSITGPVIELTPEALTQGISDGTIVINGLSTGCGTGEAASVAVTLEEWAVGTDVTEAPAGPVTFTVTNIGPEDIHEFVVIRTDLSLIDLPTDDTGAVDEAAGGMEVIGEIEDLPVGSTQDLTLTLEPGAYALICNIYDPEEGEAHYQMGMRTSFTVSD
jgi:uncharacterized cupredoxin-like copper-binding protein